MATTSSPPGDSTTKIGLNAVKEEQTIKVDTAITTSAPLWPNFLFPPNMSAGPAGGTPSSSQATANPGSNHTPLPGQMQFPAGAFGTFFNPAAFAAAAAACLQQQQHQHAQSGREERAQNIAFPTGLGIPQSTTPTQSQSGLINSKPRKRARGSDGETPDGESAAGAGMTGTGAAAISAAGAIGAGGFPCPAKTEAASTDGEEVPVADRGGGFAPGVVAGAWPQTAVNVLTPSLFGGEMSNQERKERRKIRNRLSAQQHRERQRERVETLEGCLRERDKEIGQLKDQVAILTEKNRRLTSRVLQLEAGTCPTLEDVLMGLEDESAAAAAAASAAQTNTVVDSKARAAPVKDLASSFINPPMDFKGPKGVAVMDGGTASDTDGSGVTTDPAHSSSESDSDDLSPVSTLGGRSGQPRTPPLSPARSRLDPIDECDDNSNDNLDGLLLPEALMDVEHTATSKGVESAAEAAEDVREDGNHPAVGVGLGFADAGGYGYDDDLTMAALDPMEIDALLLSVDGGIMSDTNTPCVPGANAATATSGITSPRQLEEGIIAETSTEIGHGRERRRNSPGSHSSARVGVSRTRRSRSAEEDLDSGGRRQGVAGTVAAGVMGALCLAGVVINSGVPAGGTTSGKALVVSPPAHRHAGGRVLSTALDDEESDGEYVNVTTEGTNSWVFHPVEAEPWRWRATALRERRAPWIWERALDLFGDGCRDDSQRGVGGSGGELVRSDPTGRRYVHDGVKVYRPIAPPPGADALPLVTEDSSLAELSEDDPAEFSSAFASEDLEGISGDIFDFPEFSETDISGSSGKALDLYRHGLWTRDEGMGTRHSGGTGGIGREAHEGSRAAGAGSTMRFPPDRTSYMFCPEAHGMMSGGMIDRANKATYDYHHPGARPRPARSVLRRAAREGRPSGSKLGDADDREEVQISVLDLHRSDFRRTDSSSWSSGLRLLPGESNPHRSASMALVSAASRGLNFNGDDNNFNLNFNSNPNGNIDNTRSEGRRRRRGPSPIHGSGVTDLDEDNTNVFAGGGHKGFQSSGRDFEDGEYVTMLVPSDALDWGSSSLAVRAALNATTDGSGAGQAGEEGGAWVEIGCQILSARLVQDVTFSG